MKSSPMFGTYKTCKSMSSVDQLRVITCNTMYVLLAPTRVSALMIMRETSVHLQTSAYISQPFTVVPA